MVAHHGENMCWSKAIYLMARTLKKQEERPVSHNPLQGNFFSAANYPTKLHLVKFPSSPTSAKLGTKHLTHGPAIGEYSRSNSSSHMRLVFVHWRIWLDKVLLNICAHQGFWFIVFLYYCCVVLIVGQCWHHNVRWEMFSLLLFLEVIVRNRGCLFLKCFVEFFSEAICAWKFLL